MFQHLSTWFDFGAISNDLQTPVYWASLNNRIYTWYRGHKPIAKTRFTDFEGDVEAARAQAPDGMDLQCWSDTIDHFLIDKHKKRSTNNKECRKMQVVKNRGGTCNYGSGCFKNNLNILEAFHRGHVNIQGKFVDLLVEDQYDVDINAFLQNLKFVNAIGDILRSFKNQINKEQNNDVEDEDT
ncbi:unnamed protein product [Lactuca saligna]|uniref:Uncharacterized protein n=1 Tax=Lactuca saligna TaxID=75948 RepID=A0AA36E5E9_LACSI|nr:unnamed protein product [Lactuca saligna]